MNTVLTEDELNQMVDDSIARTVNEIYPELVDSKSEVKVSLLSDLDDEVQDRLLQYIDYAYEEIQDELKHNKEYLINFVSLNVKLVRR